MAIPTAIPVAPLISKSCEARARGGGGWEVIWQPKPDVPVHQQKLQFRPETTT